MAVPEAVLSPAAVQAPSLLVACVKGFVRVYGLTPKTWKLQLRCVIGVPSRLMRPPHAPPGACAAQCRARPFLQLGTTSNSLRVVPVLERMTSAGVALSMLPTSLFITGGADGAHSTPPLRHAAALCRPLQRCCSGRRFPPARHASSPPGTVSFHPATEASQPQTLGYIKGGDQKSCAPVTDVDITPEGEMILAAIVDRIVMWRRFSP